MRERDERDLTGEPSPVPVFFLSDSTGISAETLGNALLIQFPALRFERRLLPFITSVEEARRVVAILDSCCRSYGYPSGFLNDRGRGDPTGDFAYQVPVGRLLRHAHGKRRVDPWSQGIRVSARLHGMGDVKRYNARMAAVEYAIEHDDGQSMRALDKADVILVAPSRCGKTPTTMYLALQHGIFVANYPLVDEDFASAELPRPVQGLRDRCFGLTTTAARLSQVRNKEGPTPAMPRSNSARTNCARPRQCTAIIAFP